MNKYLEKIANDTRMTPGDIAATGIVGAYGLNKGVSIAANAFDSGDLTGRLGLYHGTSADRAAQIRKEGLKPGVSKGITDMVENVQGVGGKLGAGRLAFTTMDPSDARNYSIQQEYLKTHGISSKEDAAKFLGGADGARAKLGFRSLLTPEIVARYGSPNVVKLSVPEHVVNKARVDNPEFAEIKKNPFWRINPQMVAFVEHGEKNHRVFNGGVGAEYVKGSDKYQKLTAKEVLDHVKANPGRFAKGVGKALAGTGIALGSAPAVYAIRQHVRNMEKEASINIKESRQGRLHRDLGIPVDEPIPTGMLKSVVENTNSDAIRRRAQFALNARGWDHDKSAAEQYQMPMAKAIEEHKRLVEVLRSNNRRLELKELEEQGDELREMQSR